MNDASLALALPACRLPRSTWLSRTVQGVLTAALVATAACSSTGVTPNCDPGAGGSGDAGAGGSCNPRAICVNAANQQVDPSECCKDLTGSERDNCLEGFGAAP